MADDDYDLDDETGGEERGERTNQEWAALRKATSEKKKAEAEAAQAKREAAFLRAGIDPDNKRMSYFVKGYEGESTAEAIRAAAIEAGFLQPPAPTQEEVEGQQATEAHARVAALSQGGERAPNANEAAAANLKEAFAKGGVDGLSAALAAQGIPMSTS